MSAVKVVMVDNYDSFVYNIARYFEELGERTRVKRRDDISRNDLAAEAMVISPGPCAPREAGLADIKGRMSRSRLRDPDAYERANYIRILQGWRP